jgi:hypothetical protein
VAYSASRIDPLRAHGELKGLIEKYPDSFIAQRAGQRLWENMAKMPQLWAPADDLPFSPASHTLRPASSAAPGVTKTELSVKTQAINVADLIGTNSPLEPNTTEPPQKDKHTARQTRAPPLSFLSVSIIGAAGLVILALALLIIRKRRTTF